MIGVLIMVLTAGSAFCRYDSASDARVSVTVSRRVHACSVIVSAESHSAGYTRTCVLLFMFIYYCIVLITTRDANIPNLW